MSLLKATNLSKSFGDRDLFTGVNLSIPHGARIALVGPNGVGKTTLLRILVGEESPSSGQIERAASVRIGYLPQNERYTSQHTLWEECLRAFADLCTLQSRLAELEVAMADPTQRTSAMERYGRLQEEFERRGGYLYETRIQQVLTGLGFAPQDHQRTLEQLSGGQRTRALLARLLLEEPDLLVLDEPTNHLDIYATEWLESYLNQFPGAVLLVMHDRYFLDKVARTVWELAPHGLETYRGNYTAYVEQREARWEHRQQAFAAEKARLEKELDFVRRNIAGQRTNLAKGKLRRLSRQILALEKGGLHALQGQSWGKIAETFDIHGHIFSVEEASRRLAALRIPNPRPSRLKLRLEAKIRSGDLVLRTRNLVVRHPGENRPLFQTPDLTLRRGECVALIGPNGAGKTTFLKTILGQIHPLEGEVILGASLNIGYFAQTHEGLQPEHTLLEEIQSVAPHLRISQIRNYLARYLFPGDEVFKRVSALSGGEQGRLALAKLALSGANVLLLDEPTNHLDLHSQESLQSVLADFPGTIILVSHDRYLIDALATQIWEIDAAEASLQTFTGTYSEYRAFQSDQGNTARDQAGARYRAPSPAPASSRQTSSQSNRQHRACVQALEKQIGHLEDQLATLASRLETPRLGEEYVRLQAKLEELLTHWEKLHDG
jgi:ATP-binding cassette subfamily F protein 3